VLKLFQFFIKLLPPSSHLVSIFFIVSTSFLKNTAVANELEQTTKWYQIEYIIFEHLKTDDHILRYEDTPYPLKTNKQFSYVTTNTHPASSYQYTQLSENKMDLTSAIQKLKRSREVKVLDTHSWQQPLNEDSRTPPIKINTKVSQQRTLFGELQLRKSRYTHAEFKLYLTNSFSVPYRDIKDWFLEKDTKWKLIDLLIAAPEDLPFIETIGQSEIYQNIRYLKESRRIKEGEIHYIDHPIIGVIITIKEVPSPFKLNNDLSYVGE
jgi:hypothetical protein